MRLEPSLSLGDVSRGGSMKYLAMAIVPWPYGSGELDGLCVPLRAGARRHTETPHELGIFLAVRPQTRVYFKICIGRAGQDFLRQVFNQYHYLSRAQ
jgi:hypothetical protein